MLLKHKHRAKKLKNVLMELKFILSNLSQIKMLYVKQLKDR